MHDTIKLVKNRKENQMDIIKKLHLKSLGPTTWKNVLTQWAERESNNPGWIQCAFEKGWIDKNGKGDWLEWRLYHSELLSPQTNQWTRYEIKDPNLAIPQFLIGPTPTWQKHFPEQKYLTHTFTDLVKDHMGWVEQNNGVKNINDPIYATDFWGIYIPEMDLIWLFDGHHRATAVTLAIARGNPFIFKENPTISLLSLPQQDFHLLQETLYRGSVNPNKPK